ECGTASGSKRRSGVAPHRGRRHRVQCRTTISVASFRRDGDARAHGAARRHVRHRIESGSWNDGGRAYSAAAWRGLGPVSKLRILLAEDHKVMREGLRMVLAREPNMEVVGEANNGAEAITLTEQLRPDIVVMDVSMPEINGLKATETLGASSPETK